MLARAHTFTTEGLRVQRVSVEVDIRPGLPAFVIVGLADAAVREARERVQTAIRNSGYEFPARRITASLAPAGVPKAGPGLDLALACAVLAASGQAPSKRLGTHVLFGELGLDGGVRPCRGTLAVAQATHDAGLAALVVAGAEAAEARLVTAIEVQAVDTLADAVRALAGHGNAHLGATASAQARGPEALEPARADEGPDLRDVRGQHHAVEAIVIAAAGGHNLLLSGPPGTGKTMLAHRITSILPPLSRREAVEVARIHGLVGAHTGGLPGSRPFRAPHHSTTSAGLVGGAQRGWVGEAVLAHRGVLFLDELSEFARPALEALRQPVEEGRLAIVRARGCEVHPARFILLAATNPCPCGYAGEGDRCGCSETELTRYRRRLSGPLLDRIDLLVHLQRDATRGLTEAPVTSSREARARVIRAHRTQVARLEGEAISTNAEMDARMLRMYVRLDAHGERMLRAACERGLLSARGHDRVLRVARTIADLHASDRVRARDLGEALALRPEIGLQPSRLG